MRNSKSELLRRFPLNRSKVKGESFKRGNNTKGLCADGNDRVERGKVAYEGRNEIKEGG